MSVIRSTTGSRSEAGPPLSQAHLCSNSMPTSPSSGFCASTVTQLNSSEGEWDSVSSPRCSDGNSNRTRT